MDIRRAVNRACAGLSLLLGCSLALAQQTGTYRAVAPDGQSVQFSVVPADTNGGLAVTDIQLGLVLPCEETGTFGSMLLGASPMAAVGPRGGFRFRVAAPFFAAEFDGVLGSGGKAVVVSSGVLPGVKSAEPHEAETCVAPPTRWTASLQASQRPAAVPAGVQWVADIQVDGQGRVLRQTLRGKP